MYKPNKDIEAEFDERFPCKEINCDNNGTCVGYDREGEAEQQQCQYCFEERMPVKSFLSSTRLNDLKSISQDIKNTPGVLFEDKGTVTINPVTFEHPNEYLKKSVVLEYIKNLMEQK